MAGTKSDLINGAYSRMRISGLTRIPDGSDIMTALERLESMAAIWEPLFCTGYAFEDEPDPGTLHNLDRRYWSAYESNLAILLLADFGKDPLPSLVSEAGGTYAALAGSAAVKQQTQYPNRQPIGSGNTNRYVPFRRYYPATGQTPTDCEVTHQMIVNDIDIFTESFESYLRQSEDVVSYTIASSSPSKLVVSDDSLTTPDITYTVTAPDAAGTFAVKIIATTNLGRKITRKLYFVISEE